ncbi:unnamed protein product [Oreochromis niloticus]|nr:unnamed protein product [Mustela putorius furo]
MLCGFHTAGLLILILSLKGQSEVISPFQIVEARIGDDVILHCYLGPVSDVSNMTVEWTRADLDPIFIHVWPERPELQNPAYKGRTSLFTDEMKDGYMWLKISPVKLSDEGMYTCFSPELDEKSTVQLIVYDKNEKSMEDGPDQNRKEKVIYSKRDNSEFKAAVKKGESEILLTGREEEETQDEHVIETELIGDRERPEGERIIPSINIEKDSQTTTDQETDEENEMRERRMKAEGGEDEGENMMESVRYYLGVQFLPLSEKHKEELMSGKSSSMDWGIYFNLDQKAQSEQEEQFVEERETESDVDMKQLNNKKKRSKKKKNQLNNPCSRFPPEKTKQPETDQQKEANQRTLQSEKRMKGENNETEIQTQKDKDNQHHTKEKQQDRNEPEDQEGQDEKGKPERR